MSAPGVNGRQKFGEQKNHGVVQLVRAYTDTDVDILGREVERLTIRLTEREDALWRVFALAHLDEVDGVSLDRALASVRQVCREVLCV